MEVGLVLHFESLKFKIPSLEGWGMVSIFVSVVLMALAVGFAFYAVPGSPISLPVFMSESAMYGRPPPVYRVIVPLVHPSLWLAPILMFGGIALMILGIFLKFFGDLF